MHIIFANLDICLIFYGIFLQLQWNLDLTNLYLTKSSI